MAQYSFFSTGFRIMGLLLIAIILTIGGLWWLNYLGIVDVAKFLSPAFRLFGLSKTETLFNTDDPLLLDKQRMEKQQEALSIKTEELDKREAELTDIWKQLDQLSQDLEEKEKGIEDREKSFNEKVKAFENRRVNLEQNAKYLTGMQPAQAVKILLEMDEMDIVDIFRITEEQALAAGETSIVAYWLYLMPADRAAKVQRLMSKKIN